MVAESGQDENSNQADIRLVSISSLMYKYDQE